MGINQVHVNEESSSICTCADIRADTKPVFFRKRDLSGQPSNVCHYSRGEGRDTFFSRPRSSEFLILLFYLIDLPCLNKNKVQVQVQVQPARF